jgi:UDP-N-acetylmuramate--alanine ligase
MLKNIKYIYMIGIGGISMSSIAEYLLEKGFVVTGSDREESKVINNLQARGIFVNIGHKKENINKHIDLIIYNSAIHDDNSEIIEAKRLNIKLLSRSEVLGEIIKAYHHSVAVAGCHGKTSASCMISNILILSQKDPTVFLGGISNASKNNFRMGYSDYLVTEACEYQDNFLKFFPEVAVITNIDIDHLDYFKSFDNIKASFKKFANNANEILVVNQKDKDTFEGYNKKLYSFGITDDSDFQAVDISYDKYQCGMFSVKDNKTNIVIIKDIKLKVPGDYNIMNALAAITVAYAFNINPEVIKRSLENFCGVERRFEIKGKFKEALIVDDYAHHPNEIIATLKSAILMPHKTLWCVFQSHTYTRTKALFDDFAKALCLAERVIVLDIYAAREENIYGITSQDLVNKINELNGNAIYIDSFEKTEQYLTQNIYAGDLLITMGAGEAYKIGEHLISNN